MLVLNAVLAHAVHAARWIKTARESATSTTEADLFEMNARNQLMLWGPNGTVGPQPNYAQKHWQGLVGQVAASD
jgi:hypothetical protein